MSEISINLTLPGQSLSAFQSWTRRHALALVTAVVALISVIAFIYFYKNGLGLAYNDARSHLNIGRRVVEGLTPGFAQIGSVWLPLPHVLMIPTIWNDFMWHSGLAGALQSMISYVFTCVIIYKFLKELGVSIGGRILGVAVFALNLNIIYLQSTAMTELLLLATMSAASYSLLIWHKKSQIIDLLMSAFWIMLSTLVRYDGWFLFGWAGLLVALHAWRLARGGEKPDSLPYEDVRQLADRGGYFNKDTNIFNENWETRKFEYSIKDRLHFVEGHALIYATLAAFGILLWLFWNWLIFNDPLYFAFGEFSAHAQQAQIEAAGELITKHNLWLSVKTYAYALMYNSGAMLTLMAGTGALLLWFDRRISLPVRLGTSALVAPLVFNIIALYLGHSVLFVPGIIGATWFNVRYGVMMMPSIAIFIGYLFYRLKNLRSTIIGVYLFMAMIAFVNTDAVTIDDGRVGSSQKNVTEVAGWLQENAAEEEGLVLISVASHDAIVFSTGMPMSRFIHEGTGKHWNKAVQNPDLYARWIVLRTHDENDLTFRLIKDTPGFARYELVDSYPFADIYELRPEYISATSTL